MSSKCSHCPWMLTGIPDTVIVTPIPLGFFFPWGRLGHLPGTGEHLNPSTQVQGGPLCVQLRAILWLWEELQISPKMQLSLSESLHCYHVFCASHLRPGRGREPWDPQGARGCGPLQKAGLGPPEARPPTGVVFIVFSFCSRLCQPSTVPKLPCRPGCWDRFVPAPES